MTFDRESDPYESRALGNTLYIVIINQNKLKLSENYIKNNDNIEYLKIFDDRVEG